jgi:hypothetical protein
MESGDENSTSSDRSDAPRRECAARLLLALFGALCLPGESATQEGLPLASPEPDVRLADGRLFVTDGAITLAVEFAAARAADHRTARDGR